MIEYMTYKTSNTIKMNDIVKIDRQMIKVNRDVGVFLYDHWSNP